MSGIPLMHSRGAQLILAVMAIEQFARRFGNGKERRAKGEPDDRSRVV